MIQKQTVINSTAETANTMSIFFLVCQSVGKSITIFSFPLLLLEKWGLVWSQELISSNYGHLYEREHAVLDITIFYSSLVAQRDWNWFTAIDIMSKANLQDLATSKHNNHKYHVNKIYSIFTKSHFLSS